MGSGTELLDASEFTQSSKQRIRLVVLSILEEASWRRFCIASGWDKFAFKTA